MVCAKNYKTASTFVKVIPRKLLASFFRTRCRIRMLSLHCIGLMLFTVSCTLMTFVLYTVVTVSGKKSLQ